MKQQITIHPNIKLFQKTTEIPIKDIKSDTFTQIGSSMLEILRKKGGIGLSANQVGLPFKMCVIEIVSSDPRIMLNPRIIKVSDAMIKSKEGCLSLPGGEAVISRYKNITILYEDVNGKTITMPATGLFSCCIQHEVDHLNGIMIINRLSEFHKNKILKQVHRYKKRRNPQ